ncbi:MAG: 3'-5' exonuclease [Chromatiales bacterium]|jgi:DNA polymerase-3 subunit epsilon|nr:3'-5' exonuclease [Chromatiales bacterium]MDX9766100.1 3'-5' exonuclease [Ectothiorhodospiraceae bacterium]
MTRFAAIDFETASHGRDSACALGVVIVEDGRIVERRYELIRPPSREFTFTHIHGLSWADVQDAPGFDAVWRDVAQALDGVQFLAAHNAPFDRGVLGACCASHRLPVPALPFVCTVQVARAQWDIRPTRLPDVCRFLGIELDHHHAASDAEACARIVIAAGQAGWRHR